LSKKKEEAVTDIGHQFVKNGKERLLMENEVFSNT